MRANRFIPIAAVLFLLPLQASAEPTGDWTAWYGCWRAVAPDASEGPLVCVLPGGDASSVRIATIVGDAISDETVVRADGVARPIEEGGCTGSESAFFSADGRRVFTRAELACSGLGRTSTGVLGMIAENEWVDAQALTVNVQHAARTIRYRAADPSEIPSWVAADLPQDQRLAQEAARLDASASLDVAAVVEASKHVAAPVVEALLAAHQDGFGLDARKLVMLEEMGVPASTIDVMVALSYPQQFAVAPSRSSGEMVRDDLRGSEAAWADSCYDPYWTVRRYRASCSRYSDYYGFGYSRYDRFGYSPYGYDPYGWNYGQRPIVIITRPDEAEPTGGTVVKGRGYSRNGSSSSTARPRNTDRGIDTTAPARATPRSATSSTRNEPAKPAPTRTAKPRGGN